MRWHHPFKYAAIKSMQIYLLDSLHRSRKVLTETKTNVTSFAKRSCKSLGIKFERGDKITIDDTGMVWLHRPTTLQKSFNNDCWTNPLTTHAAVKDNGGLRGSRATKWK